MMESARELIIEVAGTIAKKNIDQLLAEKTIPDGVKESLERIRKIMKMHSIPAPKGDKDFYEKIIRPAYLELIRLGG